MSAPQDLRSECDAVMRRAHAGQPAVPEDQFPTANRLADAAIAQIEQSLPEGFELDGVRYFLRTKIVQGELAIFETRTAESPLAALRFAGLCWHGFVRP